MSCGAFASSSAAVLVARVAVHTVVHISADLRMFEVGRVVSTMAAGALEHRIIGGVGVAGGAD